jgi:hypothetical protein
VSGPLRWTMALAVVGGLGFAAGWYLSNRSPVLSHTMPFPVFAPSSPTSADARVTADTDGRQVPATLHEIMKLPGDFTQSAALYVLAANSDRKAIERLLKESESIDRGSERRAAASILYQRYAELDPAAAVEHMMSSDDGFDPSWLYTVFYSWARTDLDGAIASAAKLDDQQRQMVGTAIVRSRDDLSVNEREALGPKLDVQVAVRDPTMDALRSSKAAEGAWQSALAIGDRDARQAKLYSVAHQWARQDPQAAIRAIESLQSRSEREQLLQHAVHAWAEKNAREAVEWVLERPPSFQRSELLMGALNSLVTKEPSTAMTMMDRLSTAERQQMLPMLVMSWASVDPHSAAEWAEKQDDPQVRNQALMMVASALAERDPDEALRWAARVSGEQNQEILGYVLQQIAQNDPERASRMVGQMSEGPQREGTIAAIAQIWARWEPQEALAWVSRQPKSDATADTYSVIYGQWATYDAGAAVSQLSFMLDTDNRNAAIRGILENAALEPDLVDRLYQRIEGPEAKRQAAVQIYYRLRESDPRSAERYRNLAGISAEQGDGVVIAH